MYNLRKRIDDLATAETALKAAEAALKAAEAAEPARRAALARAARTAHEELTALETAKSRLLWKIEKMTIDHVVVLEIAEPVVLNWNQQGLIWRRHWEERAFFDQITPGHGSAAAALSHEPPASSPEPSASSLDPAATAAAALSHKPSATAASALSPEPAPPLTSALLSALGEIQ